MPMRRSCAPCFPTGGLDPSRSHGSRLRSCGAPPPTASCTSQGPVNRFPFRNGGGRDADRVRRARHHARLFCRLYAAAATPQGECSSRTAVCAAELGSGRVGRLIGAPRRGCDRRPEGAGDRYRRQPAMATSGKRSACCRRARSAPPSAASSCSSTGSGDTAFDLKLHLTPRDPAEPRLRGAGAPRPGHRLAAAAARPCAAGER